MHRPQDLFDAVEHDAITWFLARMICGKAAVIGRMPIFGRDDETKVSLQFVGYGNDFITVGHWQRAARQKIILKIDDDQRVHSIQSRCSFAREINLDLNSCSEFSRPTS